MLQDTVGPHEGRDRCWKAYRVGESFQGQRVRANRLFLAHRGTAVNAISYSWKPLEDSARF
jgi:hypothetical protein